MSDKKSELLDYRLSFDLNLCVTVRASSVEEARAKALIIAEEYVDGVGIAGDDNEDRRLYCFDGPGPDIQHINSYPVPPPPPDPAMADRGGRLRWSMKKRREQLRYILINSVFVWFAWAAVVHGGWVMFSFAGITLAMLFAEVLLLGMAYYFGFGRKMADNLLEELPVPLWCELAFDVAFTAWLVWLGHDWVTVAAYAAASVVSGDTLLAAWTRRVETVDGS